MVDLSESHPMHRGSTPLSREAPLVYILILNWNGWKDTIECINSCLKLAYPNYRILIIDNGSSDNSEEILKKQFPNLEIIQTGSNLGFAGGNNVGIRQALKEGADYVWLLNNDTVVDSNALTELVKVAESDETIGIVGSKIYFLDLPNIIWSAGSIFDQVSLTPYFVGYGQEDRGQFDEIREVEMIVGCSLMLKRSAIERTGLMDERFYLQHEESDWCWRIKKNGYKIYFVPRSVVRHKVSQSIVLGSTRQHYYSDRNALLFLAKHKPLLLFKRIFQEIRRIYWNYCSRNYLRAEWQLIALWDFLSCKFGHKEGLSEQSLSQYWALRVLRKISKHASTP